MRKHDEITPGVMNIYLFNIETGRILNPSSLIDEMKICVTCNV